MFIALLRLPSPSARNSFYSGTEPHNGHAAATVSMRPLRCERLHIASSNTTTSSGTTASIDTMKLADSHSDRLVRTPSIGHRSWAPRAPPWSHLLSYNPVQKTEYWLYWAFYTDGRRNKVIWSVPVVSRWRPMQSLWKMILYVIDHFIQSRIRSGGQVLILCVVHLWHKWETLGTSVSLRFVTPTVTPTVLYRQRVGTGMIFLWSAVKTSIQTNYTTL